MKFTHTIFRHLIFTVIMLFSGTLALNAQQKSTYEVKAGETLYSISKKLDVTIAELSQWNNLEGNTISIGQKLTYFEEDEKPDTVDSPPESNSKIVNSSSGSDNTSYTVKSGDNLYSISREHNMTVDQLKELNNLENNNLSVGQKLAVRKVSVAPSVSRFASESSPQGTFSIYEVERGESLSDLLRKFKMSEREFKALNPEISLASLSRGQEVTVLLPPSRNYGNPYLQKANLQDLGEIAVISYDSSEKGKSTTNGQLYDPESLTAAHSNIALGSIIFVENKNTGKGIYVQVNDRITGSGLKLSNRAFRILELQKNTQPTVTIYTDN